MVKYKTELTRYVEKEDGMVEFDISQTKLSFWKNIKELIEKSKSKIIVCYLNWRIKKEDKNVIENLNQKIKEGKLEIIKNE